MDRDELVMVERRALQAEVAELRHQATAAAGLAQSMGPSAQVGTVRAPAQSGVLLVGIGNFQEVDDTLGGPGGDALLCQVAARLREGLRSARDCVNDDRIGDRKRFVSAFSTLVARDQFNGMIASGKCDDGIVDCPAADALRGAKGVNAQDGFRFRYQHHRKVLIDQPNGVRQLNACIAGKASENGIRLNESVLWQGQPLSAKGRKNRSVGVVRVDQ
jgi:hypothetical protein